MDYVTVEQMVKEAKENLHEFSVEDVKKNLVIIMSVLLILETLLNVLKMELFQDRFMYQEVF